MLSANLLSASPTALPPLLLSPQQSDINGILKRGRGRPRKYPLAMHAASKDDEYQQSEEEKEEYEEDEEEESDDEEYEEYMEPEEEEEELKLSPLKTLPTDQEIVDMIRRRVREFLLYDYTPSQVVTKLGQYFGVDMKTRYWYISEVYHVLYY